jgi:phosphate transport system substrate-binding protein
MPIWLRYARIAATAVCILLTSESLFAHAGDEARSVHLHGSTTLLPLVQRAAESYMHEHPDASIVITAGGTARGYKSLLDGTADIAMASGAVSDDVGDELTRNDVKLKSTTLGYGAIVVAVHPSNPVGNLSMRQLRNIFTGHIHNWKDLGGRNAPIKVLIGPPSGGITDTWKRLILGADETYTPAGMVMSNADRIEQIAKEPLAITFLTLGTENNSHLKILTVNGVNATASTVRSGRYPLRAPLMLVTTQTPSAAARAFIQYCSMPGKIRSMDGMVSVQASD